MRYIQYGIAAALLGLTATSSSPASAQASNATVVATCGTQTIPSTQFSSGTFIDTTGNLCMNATANGTTNVITSPTSVAPTNRGGTLTTGNTAQNAMASNTSRKAWCVQNDPAETETLYVRSSGTASSTAADAALVPGAQACNTPSTVVTAAVSVVASDTGHRWYGWEAQ